MKNIIKRILISSYYFFKKKDNNLIVISSYRNEKFSFYSRVFFEYLISKDSEFEVLFVISEQSTREKLKNKFGDYFISFDSFSDLQKIYSAKFWVVSTKSI
ncbi:CDP-glycerol glycerophosphotransferase family protein, partial [Vibrio sagamiensis]